MRFYEAGPEEEAPGRNAPVAISVFEMFILVSGASSHFR